MGPNYVFIPQYMVRKMLDEYGPTSMMFTMLSTDGVNILAEWLKEHGYTSLEEACEKWRTKTS